VAICLSVSDAIENGTATDVRQAVPLRRNQGFRMLWIGQLLSDTGSGIGMLAYPLLILAPDRPATSGRGAVGPA
jgi:hypothetical protein